MSVNKVILLGRLGQNPEIKYTPTGMAVCNFSLATTENWQDKGGQKQERTEWHRVVVWGKLAELCNQYLAKGRQVFVEGKLQTRSWEKDGKKNYATEIVASTVQFLDSGKEQSEKQIPPGTFPQSGGSYAGPEDFSVSSDPIFTSDDIPF